MKNKIEFHKNFKKGFSKLCKIDQDKVLNLLADIQMHPKTGIGKPKLLKGNLSGYYSRRVNKKDRLIYRINNENILVLSCRGRYLINTNLQ